MKHEYLKFKELNCIVERTETEYFEARISLELGFPIEVIAPLEATDEDILLFLNENEQCIRNSREEQIEFAESLEPFTEEERQELEKQAEEVLPKKAKYYADKMGVSYNEIAIHHLKSMWGICGDNGVIIYNWLMMALPEDIIDYLVVHELCHLRVMNHEEEFWNEVEKIIPDGREKEQWIRENEKYYAARDLYQ